MDAMKYEAHVVIASSVEAAALPTPVPLTEPPAPQTYTTTMTIETPCVVTIAGTTYAAGTAVRFSTTGALPTGVVAGTEYYLGARDDATYKLYATAAAAIVGGTSDDIDTTGSQSGTHTATIWTNGRPVAGKRGVIPCSKATRALLFFAGTAAADKDSSYQVQGVQHVSQTRTWIVEKVAAGVGTLGSCSLAGVMTNGLVADTLTETTGCPLASVYSPANDTPAVLTIDVSSFDYLIVDVTSYEASDAPTTMAVLAMLTTLAAVGGSTEDGQQDIVHVISEGVEAAAAGNTEITLHASTLCQKFRFWLDAGSSVVRVSSLGAARNYSPAYGDDMGPQTIRLSPPATSITVFFDGAVGNLNWVAGN